VWTYDFDNRVPPLEPPTDTEEPPVLVGQAYQTFNFETGPQGWTSVPPQDPQGIPAVWTYGSPGMGNDREDNRDGMAWSFANEMYRDKQDAVLLSPPINTESGPGVIQFGMKLDTEAGYDEVTVQYSTDDGATWTSLGSYSGRFPEYPKWSTVGLPFDSPGGEVQFRFRFLSDEICSFMPNPVCAGGGAFEGVRVDNVKVGKPQ
jgi:hypothetical protein